MGLTNTELPEHHLMYEINMFLNNATVLASDKLCCLKDGGERDFVINSFLESFLVHTRNLMDFLWETKKNKKKMIFLRRSSGKTVVELRPEKTINSWAKR